MDLPARIGKKGTLEENAKKEWKSKKKRDWLDESQRKILKKLYTTPGEEASFTSAEKLWKAARKQDKQISRKNVEKYLNEFRGNYLHSPADRRFKRRKIVVATFNEILGIDLADFVKHRDANNKQRYILLGVDLFSRKAYAQIMENKTCESTIKAFKKMFGGKKIPYRSVFSDMGGEFNCREFKDFLKKNGLKIYFAKNYAKVSIVERFIRTLRLKIKRFMVQMHTENYVNSLQDIISSYNKTYHRSIGTSPESVNTKNSEQIFQQLYKPNFGKEPKSGQKVKAEKKQALPPYKFKVGDLVRLSNLYKKTTDKESYHQNWTEETFRVIKRSRPDTVIPIYVVEDLRGGDIDGRWYTRELKLSLNLSENKILDPDWEITETKKGRQTFYTVKYKGWPKDSAEELNLRELNIARKRSETDFSRK